MNCRICGRQDARIRLCELNTARITKRAHVDCYGHSEYRSVAAAEVDAAIGERISHNASGERCAVAHTLDGVVGRSDSPGGAE